MVLLTDGMLVSQYVCKESLLSTDWNVWRKKGRLGASRLVSCLLVSSWIILSNMMFGLDVFLSFIWIFSCVTL